ncbi:uncharacterized protein METZ01_LOCUS323981, partial [marine metagenome]
MAQISGLVCDTLRQFYIGAVWNNMERTPRHLVLDFGGVITRSLFENRIVVEKLYHLPKGTLGWYGPFDPANDELWQRYLVGAISERKYWYQRCQELEQLVG